jgi:hypothetical protein
MEFENRFMVTRELYMDWVRRPIRKSVILMKYLWIALTVLLAAIAVIAFVSSEFMYVYIAFVFFVYCIYRVLFRTRIMANKQFNAYSEMQGMQQWERVTTFSDVITVSDGCSTTEHAYDRITEIVDIRDYLALGIGESANISYLRLMKNGFTGGTYEAFVEFIKSKRPNALMRSK